MGKSRHTRPSYLTEARQCGHRWDEHWRRRQSDAVWSLLSLWEVLSRKAADEGREELKSWLTDLRPHLEELAATFGFSIEPPGIEE